MKCPECKSEHIRKNGMRRGKQNHICVSYDRQFVENPKNNRGYSDEIRQTCFKIFVLFSVAKGKSWFKSDRYLWLSWLIMVASIPDLDYVIKPWNSYNNQGLRITHSILFSLIAPCFSILILLLLKFDRVWRRSIQVVLAGLSHLVLDLSVGVTPLPLLFPFVKIPFRLPFGILPSAGRIDLHRLLLLSQLRAGNGCSSAPIRYCLST